MAEIIRMPRLSDTMEEGNIISWLKNVGDDVAPGDILAEVETDKATMDLESFNEGVLLYIGVEEGTVPVDGIIAVIGEKGEDFEALIQEAESSSPAKSDVSDSSDAPQASSTEEIVPTASATSTDDQRIKASPLARAMAKENQIELKSVSGTGEGGRIVKADIEKAIQTGPTTTASTAATQVVFQGVPSGESTQIPITQMRKTIARRLSESKFGAPHFYLTVEIDMARAMDARKAVNDLEEHKISFNDIVVKATAAALRRHPKINSSWGDGVITQHGDVHIGVAVAVEEGLLVPVIHHADQKPMHIINAEVREKAGRAREKRLKPEEMQGNTFTISNLGMFGIEEFTAIINPPDSCILAVGSIIKKPIVKGGEIVVGNMMKVTLSCDHRVVDGATGAQFLNTLKNNLENPLQMLV
ncbi:MAG: pyruvate dehydrogenase complex dihydrolipoamide acetyltransferase [Bacteroidota bacterium]